MKTRWLITLMCQMLEVITSGYFGWEASGRRPERPSVRCHSSEVLLAHIRFIHEQLRGEYGWSWMHRELLSRGLRVGK
jgi:putative transposase